MNSEAESTFMDNNTINATVKALADELLAAQVEEARSRLLDDRLVDLAAASPTRP